MNKLSLVILAASVLVAAAGCAQPTSAGSTRPSPTVATATPAPSVTEVILPDGTYTVGVDIEAGIYVAEPSTSCYWARFDSTGTTIDNDFSQGSRVSVTVKASDYSFHSQGCGGWTLVVDEDTSSLYPDSPEADKTKCSEFVEFSGAEKSDIVGRFLATLRERDGKGKPSKSLIRKLTTDVVNLCEYVVEEGDPEHDFYVGLTVGTNYRDGDTYSK